MRNGLCVVSVVSMICRMSFAGEPEVPPAPPSIEAIRTTDAISIDGDLTEPIWRRPGMSTFYQREPDEGKPATERTEIWFAYDDAALYVAARMYDNAPDSIVARLVRRDAQVNTDDIAVFIDPYHDRRSGFYFGINAAGTLYDAVLYNDDWDDNTWDGVWEGKATIDDRGWTAELRIPYSQLRFKTSENQVWGVNFIREISRKNEKDYIVYTPRNGSGFVSRFVDLVGISHIDPPGRIEVLPYLSTKAEYVSHPDGDPFNNGHRYSPSVGADLKFGIGSNLTVDATVNPDFGQVEVDPAVVNLSDVETFFDEKRPFFIEGSTIFNFGQGGSNNFWGFNWGNPSFFYSRRIGRTPQGSLPDNAAFSDAPTGTHIIGAAKLSGKIGDGWSVGSINAITSRENARVDTSGRRFDTEVEPLTYYGVFRGQKEFDAGRQGIGFLSTISVRSFDDDHLRDQLNSGSIGVGLDGWTFMDSSKVWVVTGWAGMTYLNGNRSRMVDLQRSSAHYFQRPDAGYVGVDSNASHLQGFAGRLALNKQKGNFYVNAAVGFVDPSFDVNDLGYMWRTDVVNGHIVLGYRWSEPNSVTRQINLNASIFRSYDFGKNVVWSGYWTNGYVQFLSYHNVDWFFAYNPQSFSDRRTRGGPLTINPRGYEIGGDLNSDDRRNWIFGAGTDIQNYSGPREPALDLGVRGGAPAAVALLHPVERLIGRGVPQAEADLALGIGEDAGRLQGAAVLVVVDHDLCRNMHAPGELLPGPTEQREVDRIEPPGPPVGVGRVDLEALPGGGELARLVRVDRWGPLGEVGVENGLAQDKARHLDQGEPLVGPGLLGFRHQRLPFSTVRRGSRNRNPSGNARSARSL